MSKKNRKKKSREANKTSPSETAGQGTAVAERPASRRGNTEVRMVTHINFRFLLILAALCVSIGAGTYFLHGYMVQRNSFQLKENAERSEEEGDYENAIDLYSQYLRFSPDDLDALESLGNLVDQSAPTASSRMRAYNLYSELLNEAPDRAEAPRIRFRLVQLMMSLGEFAQAENQISKLFKILETAESNDAESNDNENVPEYDFDRAELLFLLGHCEIFQDRSEEALASLLTALSESPKHIDYYSGAIAVAASLGDEIPEHAKIKELLQEVPCDLNAVPAGLLACFPTESEAEESDSSTTDQPQIEEDPEVELRTAEEILQTAAQPVIDYLLQEMVDKGQPVFEARLARAGYYLRKGDFEQVDAELQQIPEGQKNQTEVALFEAEYALQQASRSAAQGNRTDAIESIDSAEQAAKRGSQQDEYDLRFDLLLANVGLQRYQFESEIDDRQSAVLESQSILQASIEKIPAARESFLKVEDLEARNLKFEMLNLLEIDLRSKLVLLVMTLVESSETYAEQVPSVETVNSHIDELEELTRDDALLEFLEARKQYSVLKRQVEVSAEYGKQKNQTNNQSWGDVIEGLKNARTQIIDRQTYRRTIDRMLNQCYQQLDNDSARLALFRDAFERDAGWREGRLELARALRDNGQFAEAHRHFVTLWEQMKVQAVPVELIRSQIQSQQSLPRERREWHVVGLNLAKLLAENPDNVGLRLLDVEVKAQQGFLDDADLILVETFQLPEVSREERITLWQTRIRLQLLRGDQELSQRIAAATTLLKTARESIGDCVELELSELLLAGVKSDETLDEAANQLLQSLGRYDSDDQIKVLETLIAVYKRLEQPTKEKLMWETLAERQPENLTCQLALGQTALRNKDNSEFKKRLAEIRRIEGADGLNGNLQEATWCAAQYEQALEKRLKTGVLTHQERALDLLDRLQEQRPSWNRIPILRGYLAGLSGDEKEQGRLYLDAVNRGARKPNLYPAAFAYLESEGRDAEKVALAERIRRERPQQFTAGMAQNLAISYFRNNQYGQTGSVFRESVEDAPEFQRELTEGYLKLFESERKELLQPDSEEVQGFYDEAERHFLAAADKGPDQPRVWTGLVLFYLRTGQTEEAKQAVVRATEDLPSDPPLLKPLTLANCYELLAKFDQAEKQYHNAAQAEPDNLAVHVQAADFYRRTSNSKLERTHLQKIVSLAQGESDSLVKQVESRLTYLDSLSGTYSAALAAVRKLEKSLPPDGPERLKNLLAQSAILTRYGVYDFQTRLIKVLENIQQIQPLPTADQITLIRLQEALGNPQDAERGVQQLISDHPTSQVIHTFAAEFYINRIQGDETETDQLVVSEAEKHLSFLQQQLSDSIVLLSLRANLEDQRGDTDAAEALIHSYLENLSESQEAGMIFEDAIARRTFNSAFTWLTNVESLQNRTARRRVVEATEQLKNEQFRAAFGLLKPLLENTEVQKLVHAARIRECSEHLDRFERLAAAEAVYRRYLEVTENQNAPIMLISLLGRQGKAEEAIQLGEQVLNKENASRVLTNLLAVMRNQQLPADQEKRIKALLDRSLAESPNNLSILRHLADYQDFKQLYDDAELTYARILNAQPNSLVALNNLSWLLSMRNVSPMRTQQARKFIDQAIELVGPVPELLDTQATIELSAGNHDKAISLLKKAIKASPSPIKMLHLSRAQMKAGKKQEALKSFEKAKSEGLNTAELHPLEQKHVRELQGAFLARR